MAANVILVEARPRSAADGAQTVVRLAGGGGVYPYFYDNTHWKAGIAGLPRTIASVDFDGEQLGGGGVPQAMELGWSPATRTALAEVAALYWADAPITVRIGPEGEVLPPIVASGLVLDGAVDGGGLRIALSDAAAELKKPLLTDRFLGTGGIEGPVELENIIKSRAWGRCFNVPGQLIDRANVIWCFGDPRRAWRSFVQVRDRGVAATAVLLLDWQGTPEATFTALKGTAAPQGGCVVCPSIACVKWWAEPSGDLKADIEGETAGGYVATAPEIAARLVAVRSAIPIAPDALTEASAWRPASYGWRVDNESITAADGISEVLGDVSLSWLLIGGELRFRRWEWTASTRTARSHRVTRRSTVKPVGTRKLGYRRNWSPMARGDLAAIVLAQDVAYEDGTPVDALKPAQAGADVTGQNTAKDTAAVSGRPAGQVTAAIDANRIAVDKAQADLKTAQASLASNIAAVQAEAARNTDAVQTLITSDLNAVRTALGSDISAAQTEAARNTGAVQAILTSDLKAVRTALSSDISAAQTETAKVRTDLTDAVALAQRATSTVATDLSAEVARARTEEGALLTKVVTAQGRADGAYSAVTEESVNRAAADSALAGRTSSLEASYGGAASGNLAGRSTFKDGSVSGWSSWAAPTFGTDASMPANPGYPAFARFYQRDTLGQMLRRDWGGRRIRVRALLTAVETGQTIGAGFFVFDQGGNVTHFPVGTLTGGQGWTWIDFEFSCPVGTSAIQPWLWINAYENFGGGLVSYYELTDVTDQRYADAKIADEAAARSGADSALAGRTSTVEAQLRGDQDSTIAARIRDEAAARAGADGALAGRTSTVEAQLRGDQDSTIAARIRDEAAARAGADSALAGRTSSLEVGFAKSQRGVLPTDFSGGDADWTRSVVGGGSSWVYYEDTRPKDDWSKTDGMVVTGVHKPGGFLYLFARRDPIPVSAGDIVRLYASVGAYGDCHGRVYFDCRDRDGKTVPNSINSGGSTPAGYESERVGNGRYATLAVEYVVPSGVSFVIPAFVSNANGFDRPLFVRWMRFEFANAAAVTSARLSTEEAARAGADSALASRTSTVEAQLRGDQDSTIAARIRDEAAARAGADSALAGRTSSLEVGFAKSQRGVLPTDFSGGDADWTRSVVGGGSSWVYYEDTRPKDDWSKTDGMVVTGVHKPGGFLYLFARRDPIPVSAGDIVRLYASVGAYGDCHGRVYFDCRDRDGKTVPNSINSGGSTPAGYLSDKVGNGAYATLAVEYVVPAGVSFVIPAFVSNANDYSGPLFVRWMRFEFANAAAVTSARLSTEEAARAGADSALASRTSTVEAQLRGDQDSTIAARIRDEAAARAGADSALASRTSTVEARAGDLEAKTGIIQTAVTDTTKKLESARLEFSAVTSGGRAALVLRSDKNAGAGVDLIGDLRVSGDVVVDGTFKPTKFDKSSMSREAQSSWSGSITPSVGQSETVPWSLGLGTLAPLGRFIWEFVAGITTNAGQQTTTTYNNRPLYTTYRDDGGLVVRATDNQGNQYNPRSQGTSMIVASTAFDATFIAFINRGNYDSGIVNEGDYYSRTLSATYTVTSIRLKATWVAI